MGGSTSTIGRGLLAGATGGLSEFAQKNPFGSPVNNPAALPINNDYLASGSLFGSPGAQSAYTNFGIDPGQSAADQAAINNLGQSQYQQTLSGIDADTAAQTKAASDFFQQSLPNTAENAQAAHLYDSSGYGQQVALSQAQYADQVASQASQEKLGALQGLQGTQTGALQRGQSLEDFTNQANVAKAIGAQMAPQPPTGKQQFGTVASGIGALSPFAKLGKAGGTAATVAPAATTAAVPTLAADILPFA